MSTTVEEHTFTIPRKSGRPVVFTGNVLATHAWQETYETGGRQFTAPTRARLIQSSEGFVAYHEERSVQQRHGYMEGVLEGTEDNWTFFRSGLFATLDEIPEHWLITGVKECLRKCGHEAQTYEALTPQPYSYILTRSEGQDIAFAGTLLAKGQTPLYPPLKYDRRDVVAEAQLYALDPGGYILFHPRIKRADFVVLESALEVYTTLVWPHPDTWVGHSYGIPRSDFFAAERAPEPSPEALKFLIAASGQDEALHRVTYVTAGQPDLAHDRFLERQGQFLATQEEARRKEEERQAQLAAEEAERNRIWAEQQEQERLRLEHEAEQREQERIRWEEEQERIRAEVPPPPPDPTRVAYAMLVTTLQDESAPRALRVQAAGWIHLANELREKSLGYGEY